MAYEMLTGHTPFDAENPLAILIQHVQEMPKPFAEARPDLEIPPEVEALVMRCLEKSADARFQSANDLSLEISRVEAKLAGTYRQVVLVPEERRAGRAEAARSQTRTSIGIPEATPYRRKRRWVVPAVAVVLVAGGLGAWAALGPTGDAAVEPPAPVAASTTPVAPPPVQPPVATKVEPSPVTMRFTSDPEGAEVVWNDRILGKTPFQKDLVPADGPGRFLFRRAGFRDATVEAAVAAGAEVAAVMKRVGAATGPAPVKGVPAGPTPTPTPTPKKDDSPSRVGDLKKMEY
jgi:serine/threonine-protein kinase